MSQIFYSAPEMTVIKVRPVRQLLASNTYNADRNETPLDNGEEVDF